jgi:hypothetical protein
MEKEETRSAAVIIKMRPSEKKELIVDANKLGMGISEFVRFLWLKFKGR